MQRIRQNNTDKICIIVPAFNERDSIKQLIKTVQKMTTNKFKIVVVNDGSNDNTSEIAKGSGATVLDLPVNLGIGGSVQTGLIYAKNNGYGVAVQVDADGQHDPKYLKNLIKHSKRGYDLVIGSRFIEKTSYKSPILRLVGIKIFSFLIRLTCKKKVFDPTSGYRVFSRKAIEFFAKSYPQEFPEPLSCVLLLKNGLTLLEVPVVAKQRVLGKSSVSNIMFALYLMVSISIAIIIESTKINNSLEE